MTTRTPSPEFAVGTEVAVYGPNSRGAPYRTSRVAKVYKNGNLIIEGSAAQFRPFGYGFASQRGDRGWGGDSIRILTPEIREVVRQEKRRRKVKELARWLGEADHTTIPDDVLAPLAALMKKGAEA